MKEYVSNLTRGESRIIVGKDAFDYLDGIGDEFLAFCSNAINLNLIFEKLDKSKTIILEESEHIKDIDEVIKLINIIFEREKSDLEYFIAIGGGALTDTIGFIASIYKRGKKLINVPTTLLGMVDAAIGGKNAINFKGIKNLIGTFHQPKLVICDIQFLRTLSLEDFKNGLVEVLKYAIIQDEALYHFLLENKHEIFSFNESVIEEMVFRAVKNKMSIVEKDEFDEKGIRIVLNFGHTIGHAIEAATHFKIKHGKAIALGMVCESGLAESLGIAEKGFKNNVKEFLSSFELSTNFSDIKDVFNMDIFLEALKWDKKKHKGVFKLALPKKIGSWEVREVSYEELVNCFIKEME